MYIYIYLIQMLDNAGIFIILGLNLGTYSIHGPYMGVRPALCYMFAETSRSCSNICSTFNWCQLSALCELWPPRGPDSSAHPEAYWTVRPLWIPLWIVGCVWKCCVPIVPNGFADHYPVFKWLFHWEYTQHFQTNPVKPNPHHHFSDVAVRYEQNHPGFIGTGPRLLVRLALNA